MKFWCKFVLINVLVLFCNKSIYSQNVENISSSPFRFEACYIGDLVSNLSGGIKKGTTYLGLANMKVGFNTQKANWWNGGEIFVNVGNTHGGQPTATMIGDLQGVSNIEAGNLTFLYELWYKQQFGKFDLLVGLQDLNVNFAASETGSLFSNSSFGIQSSISDNISSPVFPLTALGVNINWNISEDYQWKVAIFDGTPDDFESNPYNIQWKLSRNQGFLAISEFQMNKSLIRGSTGCYKIGSYYHQHNDEIHSEQKNGGVYMIADQQINNKLAVFSQIGFSPKSINNHNHYYSLGLNYNGLITSRQDDQFGVAFAYAGIDKSIIGSETAIEITYKWQINNNFYIRPDVQYVLNPAGTDSKLNNAFVGFIRFGFDFNK